MSIAYPNEYVYRLFHRSISQKGAITRDNNLLSMVIDRRVPISETDVMYAQITPKTQIQTGAVTRAVGSNGPGHTDMCAAAGESYKLLLHLGKQRGWQRSVITVQALDRTQIGARPGKPIAFSQHDPRPFVVEAQTALDQRRDFDGKLRIRGR